MYTVERIKGTASIADYTKNYVAVATFLESCKACKNYGALWSCPPYAFNVMDFWNRYKTIDFIADKIVFDHETIQAVRGKEATREYIASVIATEKNRLRRELLALERAVPESRSLAPGSCELCCCCARIADMPCAHPSEMRYSIEALGGDVGRTCSQLLGFELVWGTEDALPPYLTLVGGICF